MAHLSSIASSDSSCGCVCATGGGGTSEGTSEGGGDGAAGVSTGSLPRSATDPNFASNTERSTSTSVIFFDISNNSI